MPFDFELDSTQQQSDNSQVEVDAVADQLGAEPDQTPSAFDDQLSEVERRLEKAQYYRALLTESIFEGDDGEVARSVVEELREFIRNRLAVLLGVASEAPRVEAVFSDEEVKVLKQITARLLKKPQLMEAPKSPPSLKKVERPTAPAVKKQQPRPPPTSVPGPGVTRKEALERAKRTKQKLQPTEAVLTREQVVKDERGAEQVVTTKYRKFVDPDLGEIFVDPSGKRFLMATNDAGQKYMKAISGQARPIGVKPLPALNGPQIEAVSQKQAAEIVGRMDAGTVNLVQNAIRTPPKEQ